MYSYEEFFYYSASVENPRFEVDAISWSCHIAAHNQPRHVTCFHHAISPSIYTFPHQSQVSLSMPPSSTILFSPLHIVYICCVDHSLHYISFCSPWTSNKYFLFIYEGFKSSRELLANLMYYVALQGFDMLKFFQVCGCRWGTCIPWGIWLSHGSHFKTFTSPLQPW